MAYLLIVATICFTVAGQLLIKAGMHQVGALPAQLQAFPSFIIRAFSNPLVCGGLFAAVFASMTWMGAISLSDISFAYPFMALAIVLVLALSSSIFGENVSLLRWLGVAIVSLGLIIAARG
jgi:drug/metabolite transporter (DMT)-like permease